MHITRRDYKGGVRNRARSEATVQKDYKTQLANLSDSLLFLPGEEGARLLQALFVEGVKPAFQAADIRCYFYSELILNEGDSLTYRKEGVPLAAARPAGVGNCVEALRGHEVGESPLLL